MRFLILLSILVLAVGAAAYYHLNVQGTPNKLAGVQSGTEFRGSDIFMSTISWLESMRESNGLISHGVVCLPIEGGSNCSRIPASDESDNSLLYVAYLEGSKFDSQYSALAEREIGIVISACQSSGTCGASASLAALGAARSPLAGAAEDGWLKSNLVENPAHLAFVTESMGRIYSVNPNPALLARAAEAHSIMEQTVMPEGAGSCQYVLSSSAMHGMFGNESYFSWAGPVVVSGGFDRLAASTGVLTDALDCSEGLYGIYEATGDEFYRDASLRIFSRAVYDFWDSPSIPSATGHGFDQSIASPGTQLSRDAARAAAMAARFHDEIFVLGPAPGEDG